MKVVALLKAVPDLSQSRYSKSERRLQEKVPRILPPVSENILEAARQIKESGKEVSTLGVLLGFPTAEGALRKGLAFGLDEGYLVVGDIDSFDHCLKAQILAKVLERIGVPDILVVGGDSGFGGGGQVGLRVAELLDFQEAHSIEEAFAGKTRSVILVEYGSNQPRIPNVTAVMRAGSKQIQTFKVEELLSGEGLKPAAVVLREDWLG